MDKVVHFEIPADNVEKVKEFYEKVFGWKINPIPEMSYAIIHTVEVDEKQMPKSVGAINGGLMKRSKTAEYPVIVINVADIDEAIKKVEQEGGKVLMEVQKVGNMGLYARFKDSEGNMLGIWQDLKHP